MYQYKTKIRLHHTDAAELLFFANQFVLVHEAFEHMMEEMGFNLAEMFKKGKYLFPVVHAESDYKKPLFVGDDITINSSVLQIGNSSVTFKYEILKDKEIVGTSQIVHVAIDKKTKKTIPLPRHFRKLLHS